MYKANGRVGRSEKLEKANESGKVFVCSACGERKILTNVEFGEEVSCECGSFMVENHAE